MTQLSRPKALHSSASRTVVTLGPKAEEYGIVLIVVKLYVDDQRPAPSGWWLATSVDEAVAILRQGDVTEMSLDFDLGDPHRGTGVHVLKWLERALEQGLVALPKLEAHSGSPVGRRRLEAQIDDLVRRFGSVSDHGTARPGR